MDFRYESKLTINIEREQHLELQRLIPWGLKSAMFRNIIRDLIVVLRNEKIRGRFVEGILSRQIKLEHYNKELLTMKKEEEDESRKP